MIIDKQLQLQIVLNKLLELSYNDRNDTVTIILKKALAILLGSPISANFNNKGIIFIVENQSKLRLLAHRNISKDILNNCATVDFANCVCGMAAHTKEIQFTNCINHLHTKKASEEEHGHYSLPILYKNEIFGVLTLYLAVNHKKNEEELALLSTITNTIGIILHKKKLEKFSGIIKSKLDKLYGQQYFNTLAKILVKELGMRYCVIGKYNSTKNTVSTYSFVRDNKVLKNITYNLAGTPCSTIFNKEFCFYPTNIQELFPEDKYLVDLGVESYFGMRLTNEKGEPVGLVAMLHDKPIENELNKKEILEVFIPRLTSECNRKKFEDDIVVSELRYKDIFNKFQDVFLRASLVAGKESVITEITPSIYKLSGYTPEELVGKPSSIFYYNTVEREEMIKALLSNKQVKDYPMTFVHKNGSRIYVQITAQLIHKVNDVSEIRAVVRDVSENRKINLRKEITYLISKKTRSKIISFKSILEYVHRILGEITNNTNFFVAIKNLENNTIDFPIYFDENSSKPIKSYSRPITDSLVEYLMLNNNNFIKNEEELKCFLSKNKIRYTAIIPKMFLSFPIRKEGNVAGIMVLKSYKDAQAFTESDIELFDFIANQLSVLLERELWQQNIVDKEKYFRELVEKSNEVTGIVNADGVVEYITSSVKSVLGYTAQEVIGKEFYSFIKEELYNEVIDNFERIIYIKNKKNIPHFIKLKTKSNEDRIIKFSINNQLKNKLINGIVFNATDVTEKIWSEKQLKKSQVELKEREKSYKTIFNNSNDGIVRFGGNLNIIDANKRIQSIIGYSTIELINKNILDFTIEEDKDDLRKAINLLMNRQKSEILLEKRSIHKNGKQIVCKVFIKPIYRLDKKLDYFIAFITDVTKRNEAINKAIELEKALFSSGNVLYVNLKGVIIFASEKTCKTFGYDSKELVGKSTKIFNSAYHAKEFFESMWKTILKGEIWSGEIRNKRKDGTFYWIFGTIIPIKSISGEILYFINVRQDITELKNTRAQRVRHVIDAQEKEKENFAKELHDGLGQMLLASKMNLEAMKDEIITLDQSTNTIYENTMRLLSNSITEARNISHGLMSNVVVKFGLFKAIVEVIENVQITQPKLKIKFKQNIEQIRFTPEIEKGVYRIIQELITNILKHSEATLAVVEVFKEKNSLHILVKDNGIGIVNGLTSGRKKMGIGLQNIETRISYLSGNIEVVGLNKKGTKIVISIPT